MKIAQIHSNESNPHHELDVVALTTANSTISVAPIVQLNFQRKVGVMYCRAGQSSEEDMYNNESSGPAFDEFLNLLGERVRLKGWEKYRAQLDNKSEEKKNTHTHMLHPDNLSGCHLVRGRLSEGHRCSTRCLR